MEHVRFALALSEQRSPQVERLLECLADPAFQLDVYIASVGGVGSTELSNFLTRRGVRCNLLTDADAARHVHRPPPRLAAAAARVLYLFGDPLLVVASHYRRGIAAHQASKTAGRPIDPRGFPPDLDAYVARGEDLFGLEAHLDAWLTAPADYDIAYARYERMFDPPAAAALMRHLAGRIKPAEEVEQMAREWAASRRERKSAVTAAQRAAMYGRLAARVDALPAVFVRRAGTAALEPLVGVDSDRGGGDGDGGDVAKEAVEQAGQT